MTGPADSWARLEGLFSDLSALDPAAREAALRRLESEDARLSEELRSLLDAHDMSGPLDTPPGPLIGRLAEELIRGLAEGEEIGAFRVRRTLGHGGMGEVYLAERVGSDFEQRVALKLIRHGFETEETRARFLVERRILASLDHPGIARLIDGGVTESGRPWLAMELVEGDSIAQYCDARCMSISERLDLFRRVCEAVRFAHQRLVVHRDLKPGNILVTRSGDPKLLDFGVAKLLEDGRERTATTVTARWLTPEYASPEQMRGEPVTTASDVYALGVLLYQLLTGHRPFDLSDVPPHRLATTLDETEPRAPSTVVAASDGAGDAGVTPEVVSRLRATSPDRLRRTLWGDLDTIVLKAIRKEPMRRYGSVDALLDDIRRYVAGEPVLARPDTFTYRAGKFVQRNRVGVAATVLLSITLVAGLTGTLWQARRAQAQAEAAASERDRAERAAGLMVDLLRLSDPFAGDAAEVSARELLAAGVARAEAELSDQPDMQARLFAELGRIHMNLGELPRARELIQRAHDLRTGLTDEPSRDVAASLVDLGAVLVTQGHPDSATTYLEDALASLTDPAVADEGLSADAWYHLGQAHGALGRLEESEAAYREALELRRSGAEDDESALAEAHYGLADAIHAQGRFGEAGEEFRAALELFRRSPDPRHPSAVRARLNVATVSVAQGEYAEAEELLTEAIAASAEVLGSDHPWTVEAETGLGTVYYNTARFAESERLLRSAVEKAERTVGESHLNATMIRQVLAATLSQRGAGEEAVALLEKNLGFTRPGQPVAVLTHLFIADAEVERGRGAEAMRAASEGLALAEELFGADSPYTVLGTLAWADAARALGRLDEAAARYAGALETTGRILPPDHHYATRARTGLAWTHLERGELTEAERLFTESLATRRAELPATHPGIAEALLGLGRARLGAGDRAGAEAHLREAWSIRSAIHPPGHDRVREVDEALRSAGASGR